MVVCADDEKRIGNAGFYTGSSFMASTSAMLTVGLINAVFLFQTSQFKAHE